MNLFKGKFHKVETKHLTGKSIKVQLVKTGKSSEC